MTRVAIYARQSLDKTGEALAVSRQVAECRELAARNGWAVAREYIDNDSSATSGKRPEWARLLVDLDAGRYDVLVCWHSDRLYRRLRDLVDLVEIAERRALRISTVKAADLDLSTPAGRMLAGMLGHAARYEVEQKGARQRAANRQRAKSGDVRWTRRPYGYDRHDGRVVVVEDEAAALRRAAEGVLSGSTMASVVAGMNKAGMRTTVGGRWTQTPLRRVLLNPRMAGRVVYRGEDLGAGSWPPIFDPETFDRLAAVLTDPGRRTAPSTAVKHLLSGLVRCGRCAEPMFASPMGPNKGRYWMVYKCRTGHLARRLDLVDEVVEGVFFARLAGPDAARVFTPDVDLAGLRSQADELRRRRDGLAEMLAEGLLTPESVRGQARKLGERLATVERSIAAATGVSPVAELVTAADVEAAWNALTLARKREVIATLCTVTVLPAGKGARFDPSQVRIEWRAS